MRLTPRRNGEAKPVVIFFVPLCISSDDMAIIARISPACVLVGWPIGLIYACMMTNKQLCCCSFRPWPVDRQLYWTRWIASAAFQSAEPAKESPVLCLPIHRWLEYVQEGTGRSIPFFSRTWAKVTPSTGIWYVGIATWIKFKFCRFLLPSKDNSFVSSQFLILVLWRVVRSAMHRDQVPTGLGLGLLWVIVVRAAIALRWFLQFSNAPCRLAVICCNWISISVH